MTPSNPSERILATGGAGFIGSRLCFALRSRQPDVRVVALDNLRRRGSELQVPRLQAAGVEFFRGDVRNMEDLERAGACDVVVHAAAETSVLAGVAEDPGYVVGSNLIGSINCLELARKTGAGFILLSSSRVYPIGGLRAIERKRVGERFELVDAEEVRGVTGRGVTERFPMDGLRTLYGATKYAAELVAQEFFHMYGIRGVIDRCGVIAGPWQMAKVEQGVVGLWCARHLYGGRLDYIGHEGFQVRDILHVDDLVELLLRQIELLPEITGEIFNVGGGRAISVSLRELTTLCQDATGNEIEIDAVDSERPGDVPWYCSDYSKVESATGWVPTRKPREIIVDTCKWITEHREVLRPILGT